MSSRGETGRQEGTAVKSMDSGLRYLGLDPLPPTGFATLVVTQ